MATRKSTAAKAVASAMRRRKAGTLKSGSGARVRSRKQAIAIGLNEAREQGADVPAPTRRRSKATPRAASGTARSASSRRSPTSRKSSRRSPTNKKR